MKNLQFRKTSIKLLFLLCLSVLVVSCFIGLSSPVALAEEMEEDSVLSQQPESINLSHMSDKECVAFINAHGITIPEEYVKSPELGKIIKEIIVTIENDPSCDFVYSYDTIYDFANEIKKIVVDYYKDLEINTQQAQISTNATYELQDSTLYSNEGELRYNCYAYSINRYEAPSQYETQKQYQPGDFGKKFFSMDLTIYEMALVVKSDLETIGFKNVLISNSIPNVSANEKLICIRRGLSDYHFMRYDAKEHAWFHKPGFSAILRYNYTPTNDRVWKAESVDEYGKAFNSNITYDSQIYFIKYSYDTYTLTLKNASSTRQQYINVIYGEPLPKVDIWAPEKTGYAFDGYYTDTGELYYKMALLNDQQTADINMLETAIVEKIAPVERVVFQKRQDLELYGRWESKPFECDSPYLCYSEGKMIGGGTAHLTHGASKITAAKINGYTFNHFEFLGNTYTENDYIPVSLYRNYSGGISAREVITAYYDKSECVAEGTLITLADGRQVPVESLTGNEMLLVWNMYTGKLDSAPILFIDSDPAKTYSVINLGFSDGTTVKVISEHGFWDYDLNEYVYLRGDAAKYIGHWFASESGKVQLVSVDVREEFTTAYSPVTYGHLCYYVNGMLSMPGGITGLFNIFEVDAETMTIDQEAMARDIEQYGLFTYEEFNELIQCPEVMFDAVNGQYLKIAIGKGMIDLETLESLVKSYAKFF